MQTFPSHYSWTMYEALGGWMSAKLMWWWLAAFSLALRVCPRRGKLSLWHYVGVYLCKPKMRLPMGVWKFSHCFLGSKLLPNKLSGLEVFGFTVVGRHSGSAHMVSLGLLVWPPCPICANHQEGKQIKMCVLPAFWINMTGYWQKQDAFQVCPLQLTVFAKQEIEWRCVLTQNTWETRKKPLWINTFFWQSTFLTKLEMQKDILLLI